MTCENLVGGCFGGQVTPFAERALDRDCALKYLLCCHQSHLSWKEVEGRGHIATYIVIEDGRLNRRMPDQPYNLAMVTLDADPRINFYSNLPGTPPYQAPVGAPVELTFEEVGPDQLIHEWRVAD